MEKSIRKKFWIFALPTMAAFTIGFIVPFVYGIFLSFCKFSTVTDWKWVGFKNYTRIFVVNGSVDTTFIHSIWYTALFTVVSVLIINICIICNSNGAYKRNQRNKSFPYSILPSKPDRWNRTFICMADDF